LLTIEFEKPRTSSCDCCGGTTTHLTRFVYRDGDAYAVYRAAFADNHPDRSVSMVVSLGEWEDDSEAARRIAISLDVRSGAENYQVMVVDGSESSFASTPLLGRCLSRSEALAHPWLQEVFHITDHVLEEDVLVKQFLDHEAA
jgi:hypothetical protein